MSEHPQSLLDRIPDADVVAGNTGGTSITLADGRVVELRYSFRSLRALETRFGSLSGLDAEIKLASHGVPCEAHATPEDDPTIPGREHRTPGHGQGLPSCDACVPPGKMFSTLADAIAPGLLHVQAKDDQGRSVRLGTDIELCTEHLEFGRLQEYMTAWARAFGVAMAQLEGRGNADGAATEATAPSSSPGLTGSTMPPSVLADPIPSFG